MPVPNPDRHSRKARASAETYDRCDILEAGAEDVFAPKSPLVQMQHKRCGESDKITLSFAVLQRPSSHGILSKPLRDMVF
jgi:hypothetical protein